MVKLLFFALVALAAWQVFRRINRSETPTSLNAAKTSAGEDMVRCAHCGVHLPRSEAVMSNGEFFCSAEHMKAHQH